MNDSLLEVNQLLMKIRSGQKGRDEAIVSLYKDKKLRNSFKKMIRNEGWPSNALNTMLTDAIVAFASSVIRRKEFELKSDLYNYILVIGKRAYLKEQKKSLVLEDIEDYESDAVSEDAPLDFVMKTERNDLVQLLLGKLARNCREVLTYWASHYSMKEIAEMMGYKSDMMARKKKYKCFNELTTLLDNHPELKNILR